MITADTPTPKPPAAPIASMPAEIAKAVVGVMRDIGVLAQDGYNKHNDYQYSSVDAFLAATNPLCAKYGLIIMPIQVGSEKEVVESNGKLLNVVNFSFQFVLIHESGKTWHCPDDVRTVRLLWSGAQTSGMAQSYVMKQFMRGLFQIATGDKDADAEEKLIDEAPKQIAKTHASRKAAGKNPTSKLVPLNYGAQVEQVALDEVEQRTIEYLTGADNPSRKRWAAANAAGLDVLNQLDRHVWLRLRQVIDDGVQV